MQVVHALTTMAAVIGDDTVATFGDTLLDGDVPAGKQQLTEHLLVLILRCAHANDRLLWNHQDVHGCLGRNVSKGQHGISLIDDVRGDLAVDDLAEDSHAHIRVA